MKLPRDVDIRSGAFLLFAFVVVTVFGGLIFIGVTCRLLGTTCIAATPDVLTTVKGLVENIVAILLALMAGTAARPSVPPPKDDPK